MLLLARKKGERIIISWRGMKVVITFAGFRRGRKVAIGIDAPEEVIIMREELQDEIDRGEATGRRRP